LRIRRPVSALLLANSRTNPSRTSR
jgi:hypothetical protein